MIPRKLKLPAALFAIALLALGFAASASASPAWSIKARWGDTNLPPGGVGEFVLYPRNIGTSAGSSAEALTIADSFPAGVTITGFDGDLVSFCTGVGTSIATCTVPGPQVPTLTPALAGKPPVGGDLYFPTGFLPRLFIDVAIAPGASGIGTNTATMAGGGAPAASDVDPVTIDSTLSAFGMVPGSYTADLFDAEWPAGEPLRKAGAHPYELRVRFDVTQLLGKDPNKDPGRPLSSGLYTFPRGKLRTVNAVLPRGVVGNPEATPKCEQVDFATAGGSINSTGCPASTQVGLLTIDFAAGPSDGGTTGHGFGAFGEAGAFLNVPIYNLIPPKGVPADFGFSAGGFVLGHIYPNLDPAHDYAINSISPNISDLLAVRAAEVTFWGVPGDPSHDRFRVYGDHETAQKAGSNIGAPFEGPIRPLLSLPMDCGEDNGGTLLSFDAWSDPGHFSPEVESSDPANVEGCDDQRVRFEPSVTLQPTSRAAGGPTGLDVHLEVPQRDDEVASAKELYEQNGDVQAISTPPIKKVVVTLPEGMTLSTSAAQGLGSCSPEQIGIGTGSKVSCPDSSKYGSLTLHTTILPPDEPMHGDIYIAQQDKNPFNSFLAMYFVIHDESRGLLVKLPGKIDLDPVTGQITTTFDRLPQFPVSDLQLTLKGGVRAALANPSTCGTKTIKAEFYSWAEPNTPKVVGDSYQVSQRANGSPCLNSLGERPFHPKMSAGTVSPSAATYSPFVFVLTRTDDDQEFSQLGATLPPGLIAKIAGLSECPDAAIAASQAPGRAGMTEQLFPSCPASSQIGTTDVGSGVGQVITYIPGKVYLAGPYKGSPLSMVVITPVVAGPYDLGVIAVRTAVDLDTKTAQVSVETDPFPQIYKGIPVRLRDIRVKVDRPQTILNPTSCDPMAITSHVTGTGGDVNSTADDTAADLSERFQAANCAALGFKPRISIRLKGGTKRGGHPALRAELRARPGDANIADTTVTLPSSAFLDQAHIRTICTRVQFAQKACPPASAYGYAKAWTPLLDEPLQGPVYLRSSNHNLPDLVASLNGQISVEVSSRIDSLNGRIRSSFTGVPDAPVSKFVLSMQGGKKGLIVNSRDLCARTSRAQIQMTGHNGKPNDFRPVVKPTCKSKGKRGKR